MNIDLVSTNIDLLTWALSICLAVTRAWKRLLESSHKLWTTLDTTSVRKPIREKSLKIHFRRSNWTLDTALLTMKAIDAQRMAWITKWCTKLKNLQMHGRGMIGESLTLALPNAKCLENLYVSRNTEITLSSVQTALKLCKDTLVTATFLNVQGTKGGFLAGRWEVMKSMKTLRLEADGDSCMDFVSATSDIFTTFIDKVD